ncbi:hypothetical protein [Haloarcula salina]|uniref:Uncharacterized protein n=1 Tax=Haloarcula salina TaxID=1429914 RepID=A0AA41GBD3_9EURY|nr:hypothetical protein [Haloarcula salina]MBV0903637.1 hypothetical protein [Haloarcula salina]
MRKPQFRLLFEDVRKWLGKKVQRSTGSDATGVSGDQSTARRLFPPGGL